MLEFLSSPHVILGALLFVAIVWVVRTWLLQDYSERRQDNDDRRHRGDADEFPFYDSEGQWVTEDRRENSDRRQPHTFIVDQSDSLPGKSG